MDCSSTYPWVLNFAFNLSIAIIFAYNKRTIYISRKRYRGIFRGCLFFPSASSPNFIRYFLIISVKGPTSILEAPIDDVRYVILCLICTRSQVPTSFWCSIEPKRVTKPTSSYEDEWERVWIPRREGFGHSKTCQEEPEVRSIINLVFRTFGREGQPFIMKHPKISFGLQSRRTNSSTSVRVNVSRTVSNVNNSTNHQCTYNLLTTTMGPPRIKYVFTKDF